MVVTREVLSTLVMLDTVGGGGVQLAGGGAVSVGFTGGAMGVLKMNFVFIAVKHKNTD